MVSKNFLAVFLTVTAVFSFMAYKPADVVIAGPQLTDLIYFEEELKNIENNTLIIVSGYYPPFHPPFC